MDLDGYFMGMPIRECKFINRGSAYIINGELFVYDLETVQEALVQYIGDEMTQVTI